MTMGGGNLSPVATFPRIRALLWVGNFLYASRGYELTRAEIGATPIEWKVIARFIPQWWRQATVNFPLSSRLFRDGFHALAISPSGHLIAAVPGAIVTLKPGHTEFQVSHKLLRGTRPLHIAITNEGNFYWGEYFDNPERDEVHIYRSTNCGNRWDIAYTFPAAAIRHVHNIVYDPWQNCLWILTGDNGTECRILRASLDLQIIDTVLSGGQQARAVAAVPVEDGLYFSSDTPSQKNFVYFLDRDGRVAKLADLNSSSIYGARAGDAIFFSTMVEPSSINVDRSSCLYGSFDRLHWKRHLEWNKDRWAMRFFQYGNAILPDGANNTGFLAVSTVAVNGADQATSIYRIVK